MRIQLGWVESAMGIGVFAGGALLGAWGGFQRKILTSMLGLMGMGVGTLILALAPASVLSLAVGGAFLVGLANPLTMGPFMAVIQSTVEPDMQARILSLLWSIGSGMAPLGLMIAGPVADRVGIQAWFYLGGALCIFMGVVGLCIPAVMNIEAHSRIANLKPEYWLSSSQLIFQTCIQENQFAKRSICLIRGIRYKITVDFIQNLPIWRI